MKPIANVLAVLGLLVTAQAAEFHSIQLVTSSTAGGDLWPVSNLIQGPGSGFATDEPHAQIGSGSSHRWVTDAPGGFPSDFIVETGKPVLVFDLGEDRALSEISLWGYSITNANGVSEFSLRFASTADGPSNFATSIAYNPTFAALIDDSERQSHPFTHLVIARFVEFTCEDNFYSNGGNGPPGGGDRVGLGEVAFEDEVPNPNPIIDVTAGVDFGNPPVSPGPVAHLFTVSNLGGDQALEVTSATVLPGPNGSEHFSISGAPLTIAAGESADLEITFDSAGAEGCFNAQLELETNDPNSPRLTILLTAGINCISPEPRKPDFSREGGTFTGSFDLQLTTPTPGAQIVYTLDGSQPSATNGLPYEGPVRIAASTQVRAATISGSHDPAVATESFVRLAPSLAGYESGLPIVIVENFGSGAIPNKGWSTSTQTGGGLIQPERQPAYISLFEVDPDTGSASFLSSPDLDSRIGIRVRGAFSSTWNPKPYSMETWKQSRDEDRDVSPLGLPKDSDWILYFPHPSYDRSMLNNTFTWELSRETGRYGTRFRFVDVFVNENGGDLTTSDRKGVYAFAEKVKRGGERIDFGALSDNGASGGWLLAINRMDPEPISGFPTENGANSPQFFHTPGPNRIVQTPPNTSGQGDDIPRQYNAFINFENPNGYRINGEQRRSIETWFRRFENTFYDDARWLDPVSGYRRYVNTRDFIDYFHLLNLAKQGDGMLLSMFPWVSSGQRKLHMGPMWDFNNGAYGNSPTSNLFFRSDRLWYPRLFDDPDYLREHIDRWYELRRGPLADANMIAIIDRQSAQIPPELVPGQGISVSAWNSRLNSMKSYLTTRAAWIDDRFFAPPGFSSPGGIVGAGFTLGMDQPPGVAGTIYYTIDGSDPRAPSGDPSPAAAAYANPVLLPTSVMARARILTTAGEWSALNEATFVLGVPADSTTVALSELMYHPADPTAEAEFIEVLNISPGPIDLTLVAFTNGVRFTFPPGTMLAPGERVLVVANLLEFETVHGPGLPVVGEFEEDTRLENAGERLTLTGADGAPIHNLRYNDKSPWPEAPDGVGFSLVLIDPTANPDHDDPASWRRSGEVNGAPGLVDSVEFSGDPNADLDRDGRNAILEHFYGTSDADALDRSFGLSVEVNADRQLLVSFPHNAAAEDTMGVIETSPDLIQWTPATDLEEPTVTPGLLPVEIWQVGSTDAGIGFVRLRVEFQPAN